MNAGYSVWSLAWLPMQTTANCQYLAVGGIYEKPTRLDGHDFDQHDENVIVGRRRQGPCTMDFYVVHCGKKRRDGVHHVLRLKNPTWGSVLSLAWNPAYTIDIQDETSRVLMLAGCFEDGTVKAIVLDETVIYQNDNSPKPMSEMNDIGELTIANVQDDNVAFEIKPVLDTTVTCFRWSCDGLRIITGHSDGTVAVWNITEAIERRRKGAMAKPMKYIQLHDAAVRYIDWWSPIYFEQTRNLDEHDRDKQMDKGRWRREENDSRTRWSMVSSGYDGRVLFADLMEPWRNETILRERDFAMACSLLPNVKDDGAPAGARCADLVLRGNHASSLDLTSMVNPGMKGESTIAVSRAINYHHSFIWVTFVLKWLRPIATICRTLQ